MQAHLLAYLKLGICVSLVCSDTEAEPLLPSGTALQGAFHRAFAKVGTLSKHWPNLNAPLKEAAF